MVGTTVKLGVIFYFSQHGEKIAQTAVKAGDDPVTIQIADEHIEAGIYSEIVPSDSGREGDYDEIQLPKVNGKQVSTNKDTYVFDPPEPLQILADDSPEEKARKFHENKKRQEEAVTCRVTILTPPLQVRRHPEGKTCGECKYFNRQRGKEELKAVTHEYLNGTMSMTEEIIRQVCDNERKPDLTVDIVGHCPINQELCADTSPGCVEFDPIEAQTAPEAQVIKRS